MILHNMMQEVRIKNYTFQEKMEWENNNEDEEEVHSIFLNEENQVGDNTVHALHTCVAHMRSALEGITKYVELRGDLIEHIMWW